MVIVEKGKADAVKAFLGSIREANAAIEVNNNVINPFFANFSNLKTIAERKLIITPFDSDVIFYKKQYEEIIPPSYRKDYTFEAGKGSYPWLWFNFKKNLADAKLKVSVLKDGNICTFAKSVAHEGTSTLSENDTVLTYEAKVDGYISWELVKDLQLNRDSLMGTYTIVITAEDGSDKQMFEIPYTNKIQTLVLES